MQTTLDVADIKAQAGTGNLRHRRHTLNPNRTFLDRCGIAAQTAAEWSVARVSCHGDPHIYNTKLFPWAAEVEQEWKLIRQELDAVMTFRDQMPSFQDILKEVGAIQSDNQWKTFFLAGIGMDCAQNAQRCPETMRLLGKIPGMTTAFFSILSPGKHIPAHRGAWNGILRFHLGLMVPEPRERVRIRIGNYFYSWREGEAFIFDDTVRSPRGVEMTRTAIAWCCSWILRGCCTSQFPLAERERPTSISGALAPFLREVTGEKAETLAQWIAFWKRSRRETSFSSAG